MGGMPWPIIISTGQASETVAPASTIRRISSSPSVAQWMKVAGPKAATARVSSWSFDEK